MLFLETEGLEVTGIILRETIESGIPGNVLLIIGDKKMIYAFLSALQRSTHCNDSNH